MTEQPRWLASPWPLGLMICGVATTWLLLAGDPVEGLEMRWLGQILRWRNELGAAPLSDPRIVHVDVGDEDLVKLPRLEDEYQNAAQIIRAASQLGAKVIAVDVIFARGTSEMAQPILDAIADAAKQNCTVVLAEAFLATPDDGSQRARSFPFTDRIRPAGLINLDTDPDGILRHYAMARHTGDGLEPALGLAAYLAWRDISWESMTKLRDGVRWEELSADFKSKMERSLSVEPVLLNFRSVWRNAFRHFTLVDLSSQSPHFLENNIVLVSYVAAGTGDTGPTPLARNQPRVLLHSTALNDLIQETSLRRAPRWLDALIVASGLIILVMSRRVGGPISLVAIGFFGVAVIGAIGFLAVWKTNTVIATVLSASSYSILIVAELTRKYSIELLERLKLRSTMSFYFSPRVLERVLQNPGSMEPQAVELTILLTDLRNSTPLAELLGARGTFDLLNKVFEAQTRAVMSEDGTLEHFLGDQFLSYWGAPDPQPDAADRAFRAALALIDAMEKLRETLTQDVGALFGYGIALHRGSALIGNKGSKQRLDYGVVGDLINAAARVESLTKYYGVPFLVTREVVDELIAPHESRLIDRVIVKGKSTSLELMEVRRKLNSEQFSKVASSYGEAFVLYQHGRFAEAERAFSSLGAIDGASKVLARRCAQFVVNPPQEWNGIFTLESK